MDLIYKKPTAFEDALSDYRPVLYDGSCSEPVAWGFEILHHLGEERFDALRMYGSLECLSPGNWALIVKTLSRSEAAAQYGGITEEIFGPRGGWKSVTFGTRRFISKYLRPEKTDL